MTLINGFQLLANVTKSSALHVVGIHDAALFKRLVKNYDRCWDMSSTTTTFFFYFYYLIGCPTVKEVGHVNLAKCLVGFEPESFDSITAP